VAETSETHGAPQTPGGLETITRQELAKILKVTTRMISSWLKAGKLPQPVRVGQHPRWNRQQVERLLAG
jgi:excisionase family DNA binding protein